MERNFDSKNIEEKWYKYWESSGYFEPGSAGEPCCILLPPPNVTGGLHMGHAYQLTIMDAIARYYRMMGKRVLWQGGIDHAGIATQIVVSQLLEKMGVNRLSLGREKFFAEVMKWKEYAETRIIKQQKKLGASIAWRKQRFTMDKDFVKAVKKVFIELYAVGLIYRGKRLVNWDPVLKTALSDLEVENEEVKGQLYYVKYPFCKDSTPSEGDQFIVAATTRPETMFGDVAIAVHPDDERYKNFVGKRVIVPFTTREIPIMADDAIDPKFGTGCLKVTPGHSFQDYEIGKRHKLPILNIMDDSAKLAAVPSVPQQFVGLSVIAVRDEIVKDSNVVINVEEKIISLPKSERTGVIIEPMVTDQWFMKMDELAKKAIDLVKDGKIKFYPDGWSKSYFSWLENIEDWCISRQLWWGHQIPAWYDKDGNVYVGESRDDVAKKYGISDKSSLKQDEDVLDTWFSSSLWSFVTLGWPNDMANFNAFSPTKVLVTGFDIIFFWVARMIMMNINFTGKIPFEDVFITGLIRDNNGRKMSKSEGNIIDPIDLIEGISYEKLLEKRINELMNTHLKERVIKNTKDVFPNGIDAYGTDALRFTFCILSTTSRDINFDFSRLDGSKHFCTKLWNAARYAILQFSSKEYDSKNIRISVVDKWIRTKLNQLIKVVNENFVDYRFDVMASKMYDFVWHEFCDWYLEFCKPILNYKIIDSYDAFKNGVLNTLIEVLAVILKLLHPIIPFITEDIWEQLCEACDVDKGGGLMKQPYPTYNDDKNLADDNIMHEMEWLKSMISAIRTIRNDMKVSMKKQLSIILYGGSSLDEQYVKQNEFYIRDLGKIDSIKWVKIKAEKIPFSATALVGDNNLEIHIPMQNVIDKDIETWRLKKEIAKINKDILSIEDKLRNTDYIQKAPPHVIDANKKSVAKMSESVNKLKINLEKIEKM